MAMAMRAGLKPTMHAPVARPVAVARAFSSRSLSKAALFKGKQAPALHMRTTRALATRAGAPPTPDNVAAAPAEAEVTASGLASVQLKAGTGSTSPGPTDTVRSSCCALSCSSLAPDARHGS